MGIQKWKSYHIKYIKEANTRARRTQKSVSVSFFFSCHALSKAIMPLISAYTTHAKLMIKSVISDIVGGFYRLITLAVSPIARATQVAHKTVILVSRIVGSVAVAPTTTHTLTANSIVPLCGGLPKGVSDLCHNLIRFFLDTKVRKYFDLCKFFCSCFFI